MLIFILTQQTEAITIDLGDLELTNHAQFKVIDVLGKEVKAMSLN